MTSAAQEQVGAYQVHQRQHQTDRQVDARALLICATDLNAACQDNADRDFYTRAIKRNQQLWTMFQVALCDPTNALPADLKSLLLNLSCYVDKVSFKALAEFKPAMLRGLVEINRNLAAGLSKNNNPPSSSVPPPNALPPGSPVMTTV